MKPTPWAVFLTELDWKLGEHVAVLGQNGSGKTHLGLELLNLRRFVVAIATKPQDDILKPLKKKGYKVARNMRDLSRLRREEHILLWPEPKHLRSDGEQTKVLREAFEYFYHTGNRAIFSDETYYLVHHLGLEEEITSMLYRGRSLGISLVSAAQRPFYLPLAVYSESKHFFFFQTNDKRNRERIAEIGGCDVRDVIPIIANLPKYHFLYINAETGMLRVSKVQRFVPAKPTLENPA